MILGSMVMAIQLRSLTQKLLMHLLKQYVKLESLLMTSL